uniref:DegT/DnrJ/EryC1/StrS family aminotransferase n=1 Tax=Shewanella sp. TaxID=50422 RepID=UPI0040488787
MIILSRPAFDYGVVFGSSAQLPPEAKNMYFYPRGRDALLVALRALRIMPGQTVIIPAYICDSTIGPLRRAGYRIVFIDIKSDFQLDPVKVLDTAEKYAAKAVLAVHYFGFPSDVSRLTELLRPRGVRVVEDCCHSFLTHSGGDRIGSKGDAAIFSMRKTLPIPDG